MGWRIQVNLLNRDLYRMDLKSHLKHLVFMESIKAKQRCRIKWTFEGDQNTSSFHKVANARPRWNNISMLHDGSWKWSDFLDIACKTERFFTDHFLEPVQVRPFSFSFFLCLSESYAKKSPRTRSKLQSSPLTRKFYRVFWVLPQLDLFSFIAQLMQTRCFICLSQVHLSWLPKESGKAIGHLHSINILGKPYTILAKLLNSHVKP